MQSEVRHLKMAELGARSGVPASTIRYYLRLGLLPEPLRTAKTMAYYGPEHVQRLAYIGRRLKDGATLREVGTELAGEDRHDASAAGEEQLHSSQRARLIHAGAATLLRLGFESTSVDEVVARAGVGKAAFYRHFADKRELLVACLERELTSYERAARSRQPSLERLLGHAEIFARRRARAILALHAMLRQVEASRTSDEEGQLESVRARLRAPLEEDLLAVGAGGPGGGERLRAEMLLSVAEYVLAYAASDGGHDVAELVRRGWLAVLAPELNGSRRRAAAQAGARR